MRIINDKDCYVQKEDIEYLIDNGKIIPNELFMELKMAEFDSKDFIKIENPVALQFILQSKILSFDELNSFSISRLERLIVNIRLSMLDSEDLTSEELQNLKEMILERRNREYLLEQLKEMVAFKKKMSKLVYPNIPNPNTLVINDGNLYAANSMNPDKIVVYNIDGSEISSEDDIKFCELAYQLLMKDDSSEEELNLNMMYEGKYLVVENISRELKKKLYK